MLEDRNGDAEGGDVMAETRRRDWDVFMGRLDPPQLVALQMECRPADARAWWRRIRRKYGRNYKRGLVFDIPMPCGNRAQFGPWEQMPLQDVPCPCGNPDHWLIKYGMDLSNLPDDVWCFG